jgi:hypothetical protein
VTDPGREAGGRDGTDAPSDRDQDQDPDRDRDRDVPVETASEPSVTGRLLAGVAEQPVLGGFVILMLLMALGFLVAGVLVLT